MMDLAHGRVIILVHEEYEDLELWYPALRLREEGVTVLPRSRNVEEPRRTPLTSSRELVRQEGGC